MQELAEYGRIPLTKTEVSQKIGELYMVKSSVNLMFDILDAPDYFWDYGTYLFTGQQQRNLFYQADASVTKW